MQRGDNLAQGLLRPMNPHGASLLGFMTLMWGLWIIMPFWRAFDTAAVYSKALEFAPEWAWGTWSTLCGLGLIIAVFKKSTHWLSRTSGFAIWHWTTVSGMLWWGDWQNTAGLTYMFIGFYAIFVFLNIRVNYVNQGISHF